MNHIDRDPNNPTLPFQGIWMPKEIFNARLNWFQKALWCLINNYGSVKEPFTGTNAWLAERLNAQPANVALNVSALCRRGFLIRELNDHNQRKMAAIIPQWALANDGGGK